jgi:energy-coupling factor transport system substrate-specific component
MSLPSLTLPPQSPASARTRRLLEILGALAIAGTYIYLVLNQPADIAGGPGSAAALIALSGFLVGAVLLILAVLPTRPGSVCGQYVGALLP